MRLPSVPPPGLVAFWALSVTSWMAVNVLAGLGLIAVLFIMLANGSWEGFFHEGGNLASHFLDASAASRAEFERLVVWIFGSAVAVLGWARFGALRAALASSQEERG